MATQHKRNTDDNAKTNRIQAVRAPQLCIMVIPPSRTPILEDSIKRHFWDRIGQSLRQMGPCENRFVLFKQADKQADSADNNQKRQFWGLEKVATPVGLEPTTSSLEGWRSIRLSYGVVIRF